MLEDKIIRHCAPTLAGLKAAGLFNYIFDDIPSLAREIREINSQVAGRGVKVLLLRIHDHCALVYVYRQRLLQESLVQTQAEEMLAGFGYSSSSTCRALALLKKRFRDCKDFPHEIGLFLGYPPEDVLGFIREKGHNCKYCGMWKVYGDVAKAAACFEQYRCCSRIYLQNMENGRTLRDLTVAA